MRRTLRSQPNLLQGWMGTLLYRHLNFPIRVMMPQGYGDAKKFTTDIRQHYEYPFHSKMYRSATLAYARELLNAGDWWEQQWNQINQLDQKPFLIFWGMKDKFIRTQELERWKNRLKNYKLITLPQVGHFVHEEAPDQMIQELQSFLS
jgi:Predicted hydrolases or acyltransferases (alpha/beta hydrolase superfamily)